MTQNTIQHADRIARRRAIIIQVLAVLFVATQAFNLDDAAPGNGPHVIVILSSVFWVTGLLLFLGTGGGLFRSQRVRAVLNDVSTQHHLQRALIWGFWTAILTAVAVYTLSFFDDISVRNSMRLVITFGIAMALFRFGMLEKKALENT